MKLQEAIFKRSSIKENISKLHSKLHKYYLHPLSVNGQPYDNRKKDNEISDLITEVKNLIQEYSKYNDAINKANYEHNVIGLIEENKMLRSHMNILDRLSMAQKTTAESGVGIVEYGVPNSELVTKEYIETRARTEELSLLIDKLNSEIEVEI